MSVPVQPPRPLHVTSFNIHKGFSAFNRRMVVHELRDCLRQLNPDILFLQEVQGLHRGHAARHDNWPDHGQHDFLAEEVWEAAYGHNMAYRDGHHGNAILSRFPILHSHNQDVTHLRFEKRGLLHCRIALPEGTSIHCVCAHLSLFARSRQRQIEALSALLSPAPASPETPKTPETAMQPLIIAGDFNDWHNRAGRLLVQRLGVQEVFSRHGQPVRSFPAIWPLLRLDRIYTRGFAVAHSAVHWGPPWSLISDHAALSAHLHLSAENAAGFFRHGDAPA